MSVINQKEYLKKYLGIGKAPGEKKKKKRKEKIVSNRLKIIDDDIDVQITQEIVDDLAAANEDAPQIVAVIDERPHSLQIDEKTNSSLWKPIGEPSTIDTDNQSLTLNSFKLGKQVKHSDTKTTALKIKELVPRKYNKYANLDKHSSGTNVKQVHSVDTYSKEYDRENLNSPFSSPERKKYRDTDDASPSRNISYDNSPPRRSIKGNRTTNSDYSPPWRQNKEQNSDSPPRKQHTDSSPLRKQGDNSPPKESNTESNTTSRGNFEDDCSPPRRNLEQDSSPPRKKRRDVDNSPPRKRIKEEDCSPPRRKNAEDSSPPRRKRDKYSREKKIRDNNYSPQRKQYKDSRKRSEDGINHSPVNIKIEPKDRDMSPSRFHKRRNGKKFRWSPEKSPDPSSEKITKTLDGKRAGLQSATALSKESNYLRQKEDEVFNKLSSEISGRNAATVVRGKKVIKDPEEEAAKAERAQAMKEKYDRWGKGLKQVEDRNKIMEEQLHEMNKPLARYADDEDLEKYLKEQEREGDPMLAYIRKKKKKEKVAAGIPEKPMYMAEFMPNRFGIRPGYRWDGVDRSNGYEKKWFQVQNEKKASQEEAFKWSTEDM